jgi:hypothetical protein
LPSEAEIARSRTMLRARAKGDEGHRALHRTRPASQVRQRCY